MLEEYETEYLTSWSQNMNQSTNRESSYKKFYGNCWAIISETVAKNLENSDMYYLICNSICLKLILIDVNKVRRMVKRSAHENK